jgi:TonB family protein
LSFTDQMSGEIEMGGRVAPLHTWQREVACRDDTLPRTANLVLDLDARVLLHWAGMTFAMRFVAPPRKTASSMRGLWDLPYANTVLASALVHLVALLTLTVFPLQADDIVEDRVGPVVVMLDGSVGRLMQPPDPPKPEPPKQTRRPRPEQEEHAAVTPSPQPVASGLTAPRGIRTTPAVVRQRFLAMLDGPGSLLAPPDGAPSSRVPQLIRSLHSGAEPLAALGIRGGIPRGGGPGGASDSLAHIGPIVTGTPGGDVGRPPGHGLGHKPDRRVDTVAVQDIRTLSPLDREVIARVIAAHRGQARFCYEHRLQRRHDLEGRVLLTFVIGPDGRVLRASVSESSLGDTEVEDCLVQRVSSWRFPAPTGGGTVEVNYPFNFRAD